MVNLDHFSETSRHDSRVELQRTCDFQATLLGMAGHDLRQPLQVIQSTFELLETRSGGATEKARILRGERAIARMTEQLDRLVDALRLWDQVRRMELSNVPLAPLLWSIANENEDTALDKGIKLTVCPTHAVVRSNTVLLDGILRNLVRNAVKYTERSGRILIGCRRSGPDVRIEVYDTGVGMAPQHLPRIFDAFSRLESNCADGLGIGLFVVRRAVKILGHRIEVRSTLSQGSRFSVLAIAAA